MFSLISKLKNSSFRKVFLPIRYNELYKFLPMSLLLFIILLNQNIVRGIKDSLVITHLGPEVINFIKLWIEMPTGLIFVILYSKLCNYFGTEKSFRIVVLSFLIFFAIFGFIILPYQSYLHPDMLIAKSYMEYYPNIKWFILIFANWSYVIFYVLGELWPIIVFGLLYWQLANKITNTEEAQRYYTMFGFFGHSNLLFSGVFMAYISTREHFLSSYFNRFNHEINTIQVLIFTVLLLGILILILHKFIDNIIIKSMKQKKNDKELGKLKLGFIDSIKMVLSSKYLLFICIILIMYSTSVNLIEGIWYSKVREYHKSSESFMLYQGRVLFYTGLFTMLISFLGSAIIRKLGWKFSALLSPLVLMIAGITFFLLVIFENYINLNLLFIVKYLGFITTLKLIVYVGGVQNVIGKGVKYSLFDVTKEMLYIPLDDEKKTKGKAAVDIVGPKIGKSLGAFVQFLTFTIFPGASYKDITGFLAILFIIVCLTWIYSVSRLSVFYNQLRMQESKSL